MIDKHQDVAAKESGGNPTAWNKLNADEKFAVVSECMKKNDFVEVPVLRGNFLPEGDWVEVGSPAFRKSGADRISIDKQTRRLKEMFGGEYYEVPLGQEHAGMIFPLSHAPFLTDVLYDLRTGRVLYPIRIPAEEGSDVYFFEQESSNGGGRGGNPTGGEYGGSKHMPLEVAQPYESMLRDRLAKEQPQHPALKRIYHSTWAAIAAYEAALGGRGGK